MNYLIFTKSGDRLGFNSPNQELLEYFIKQCEYSNASVFLSNQSLKNQYVKLFDCICTIDDFFSNNLSNNIFAKYREVELNQITLNSLHEDWVKFQLEHQNINTLLERKDPELLSKFRWINEAIHSIEGFVYDFKNYSYHVWQCDNPFGTDVLDFNNYNISMAFNNLGRASYDKWTVYDNNTQDTDTNNFTKLSGQVLIDLRRPHTQLAPVEYTSWCNDHGQPIVGHTLGIGNFTDTNNVVSEVFYRNMQNEDTSIFFELSS
jgi:hypothetical protein